MNPLILNKKAEISSLFQDNDSIGIVVGENQTLDMLAGASSLYLSLNASGKKMQLVSIKNPIVEFSNLVGVDKISRAFDGNIKTLTISVPYHEGEIEKVSYNIEGNKLNVNLFAEEKGISFKEADIKYIKKGAVPSLIIAIGVASNDEFSALIGEASSTKVISIDINPLNALDSDIALVDPSFSSISEIVAELLIQFSFEVDIDIAQNLLDGVVSATRNFSHPKTSPFAFQIAGILMQQGALRKIENRNQNQNRNNFPKEEHILNRNAQTQNRVAKSENFRRDMPNSQPVSSSDVPKDWFLPKVFKSSKKHSQ